MRIAVAFFGLPRCSEAAMPTIEQNIFSQFPKNSEFQCFFHFYKQNTVVNPRSGENGTLEEDNYQAFMKYEGLLEKPEDALSHLPFEEIKTYGDSWKDDFNSLRNLFLQLNSLKKVTALAKNYHPDVVVFARPDLVYHDPIPTHIFEMASQIKGSVFVPNWQWGKGLNDTFAVCHKEAFETYGNRIDEVKNYCIDKKDALHSERLLKYALLKKHLDIYHMDVKASRVRIGGVLAKENYKSHQSLFGPVTNPAKRFFFLTKWKTKVRTHLHLKKK